MRGQGRIIIELAQKWLQNLPSTPIFSGAVGGVQSSKQRLSVCGWPLRDALILNPFEGIEGTFISEGVEIRRAGKGGLLRPRAEGLHLCG